jgi:hypothetical protein
MPLHVMGQPPRCFALVYRVSDACIVVKEIPPYFKNQSVPIVSYSYTNSIDRQIFNYKEALQDINIEEYIKNPLISYKHDIFGSLVRRNDNIFVMKRGKTIKSFLVFKYRLRSTINTILEFVNPVRQR